MPTLPQYLLELTLCLGLFAAGYHWSGRRFPAAGRRLYLLLTPVVSLLLPLLYFGPAKTVAELTTADPEFFDHFYRGTYDPDALPPFVLHLGDLVLYVYFIGLVVAAFRLLDRWWKIYRQLARRSARRNAHYAVVDSPEPAVPYSLLPHIYWNQHRLTRHWRYLWAHERTDLRVRHAVDALWLDVLVVVLWFHPLIYWYRRRAKALHAARATRYARSKLARLRSYLHSLTPGYRFALPPAVYPVAAYRAPALGEWFGAAVSTGLATVLLLLLFSFDLASTLPGGGQLRGAGHRLTAVGGIELWRYTAPRPPDNYEFYWGRKLAVILAPLAPGERSPIPVGPSAELSLADFKRALQDEPLLSHQHGPLFNAVRFELSLERGYEVLLECTVEADAGDPDAYPANACLPELVRLVRPGDLLVFRRITHHFRQIDTRPPDFSLRIRETAGFYTGDPFTPTAYTLRWADRSIPCFQTPFAYLLCEPQRIHPDTFARWTTENPVIDVPNETRELEQLVLHLKQRDSLLGYAYNRHINGVHSVWQTLDHADAVEVFGRVAALAEDAVDDRFRQVRLRIQLDSAAHFAMATFVLGDTVPYAPLLDHLFYPTLSDLQRLVGQRLHFTATTGAPRPLLRLSLENMTSLQRVRLPDATAPYPPEWDSLLAAVTEGDLLHLTGAFADGGELDFWWQVQ